MNNIKKKYIAYIIIATVIIYSIVRYFKAVEGYIGNIIKALVPFVAGAIMAYIINILMDFYEDLLLKKNHKNCSNSFINNYFCIGDSITFGAYNTTAYKNNNFDNVCKTRLYQQPDIGYRQ